MPGRALTFPQEIRDAITAGDRLVLVVGPKAVMSEYVSAEWVYALDIGKPIDPVRRLDDYDLLPDELKNVSRGNRRSVASRSRVPRNGVCRPEKRVRCSVLLAA